jgi:succinate dehydrogenase / fumarate reductase membrane anchor subunit
MAIPSFRSPLGRARGLGSAKDGTHHWWIQRITAVALIPLTIWFMISVIALAGSDYAQFLAFVRHPLWATMLILTIAIAFHHGQLGLQVVIEDYVHQEGWKIALLLAVKFAALLLGGIAIIAVLKVAFGG